MSQHKIDILERALLRQKEARKQAEKILEDKSLALYNTTEKLKEANNKLESLIDEKNSQLKGVFENINDAYLVMDIEGNILRMNDIAEDLFAFKLAENKVSVPELIYKEDQEYATNSFEEFVNTGKFSDYCARIVTKKNEIKWVNINASIIYDKHKKPIAAQGIIRDITKQREENLILDLVNNTAKSVLGKEDISEIAKGISRNIANYLDTKDLGIYLVEKETNTLEQITVYNKNDKKFQERVAIDKTVIGNVVTTGISKIIVNNIKSTTLKEKKQSEIIVPISNDGEVIGIINAKHDGENYFSKTHVTTIENIANLVSLQLKSAINLKERIKVEQKNKDLVDKLSRSNDELKEYAHIVSHDLKSPLRSIAALTSWIKADNKDKFDEESLQNFNDIELTLETMEKLISDVLKFSSIDSQVKEEIDVDLNELVQKLMHVLYVPKNVSINILNKLPIVKGDSTKFEQLFQNLISNAIKFSDKPKSIININVTEYQSFYEFSVEDNGIGIEKRHFDKIFKIFQFLKKSEDSSGIGLSIVKKIVEIYGGKIWLTSEVNKGTTFYFTIKK